MGIFSENTNGYYQTSLEDIKSFYYDIKNKKEYCQFYYSSLLLELFSKFQTRYQILFKNKYLKELKEAVKNYDEEDSGEIITKINNIIKESNDLEKKSQEEFNFYFKLLSNLWREEGHNDGSPKKACEDVIDAQIKSYIKYEKDLIILKDKIKELNINIII
jgi:hypothetical protein